MAGSLNQVQLIGNLGADPEVRRTGSGDPVVTFRVATSETWKDKGSGERKERTEWHTVVVFNTALCEVAEKYLRKGSKAFVQGKLATRKWQAQDGADRYSTEIVLDRFGGTLTLLDKVDRPAREPDSYGRTQSRPAGSGNSYADARSGTAPSRPLANDLDDEIPF